jgi:multimeric flavodoxin WrbA
LEQVTLYVRKHFCGQVELSTKTWASSRSRFSRLEFNVNLIAPPKRYQSPSPLKLMIDRMVCADGGNPDPTTTHGKHVQEAKRLEKKGWDYPKHVAGRAFGVVVHGDVAGVEGHRESLTNWLAWMGMVDAGAKLDRYIGYYQPYYSSHDALDHDKAVQEEVRNTALAVAFAVQEIRAGRLGQSASQPPSPRPK